MNPKPKLPPELLRALQRYIDENLLPAERPLQQAAAAKPAFFGTLANASSLRMKKAAPRMDVGAAAAAEAYAQAEDACAPAGLAEALAQTDESFSEALLRLIDARGLTDPECYKRAQVDRKLFSKIRSDPLYRPSKSTAIAFAVALELDLEETSALLKKAGYALSHSSKADIIVEFFLRNRRWDLFEINEALYAYDQPPI